MQEAARWEEDCRSDRPDCQLSPPRTDQRWAEVKPKVAQTVLAALLVAAFSRAAIASGSSVAVVIVPIELITLAVVGCYRVWHCSVELTGDDTLIVGGVLRTHHIPVLHILGMRRNESGMRITLIDGRIVTARAVPTGRWAQRRGQPDQAAQAISAITQAMEAARRGKPRPQPPSTPLHRLEPNAGSAAWLF